MSLKETAKTILPRRWWDELRRLKHRSADLEAPRTMGHLRRMRRQGFTPEVVIDVGAAHGDWTISCRRIFPDAHYVLIEPNPVYRSELIELAGDRIDYLDVAAGRAKADLPLLIPDKPGGSSFLPSTRPGDPYFKRSLTVPVLPLDDVAIRAGATMLKLDVQGYELEILAGATALLKQVQGIVAECSLHPFQQRMPLAHELIEEVTRLGFRLYEIADELRWPSGGLAQVDLIFVQQDHPLLEPEWWGS